MKLQPVRGMCDRGVKEFGLRSRVLDIIQDSYRKRGFFQIQTPVVEDRENLMNSDGGENLRLIFEILKRGDKLEKGVQELSKSITTDSSSSPNPNLDTSSISDLGLRYDLTLPLCRFYSANQNDLLLPFKVIQVGQVYRAERPQKGRLREFVQCDIDIIGDDGREAEVELFLTSLLTLKKIGFKNLTLKLNDRRIIEYYLEKFSFSRTDFPTILISLDKLDKIGAEKLKEELLSKGLKESSIESLLKFIAGGVELDSIDDDAPGKKDLSYIIKSLKPFVDCSLKYDFSLIRGQGYYTSTLAEIVSADFNLSIAGGGRYDNLIGKFTKPAPAVGFSLGFERIMTIIAENQELFANLNASVDKIAILYDRDKDYFVKVLELKEELAKDAYVAVFTKKKNLKSLFEKLVELGFSKYYDFDKREMLEFSR